MNKRNPNIGHPRDSVDDLIGDAAQILWKMNEGAYYDEFDNTVTITKSAGVTKMEITSPRGSKLIIECIEEDGMGKITKISGQSQGETIDFYWATRFMTFNRNIMGEWGKDIMRQLIEKLKLRNTTLVESERIRLGVHREIEGATSLSVASARQA